MDRARKLEVIERLNSYYETGGDTLAESDMVHRATTYSDPAWLEGERSVLRTNPVIVGHSSLLPNPGDFFTDDTLGPSILVVRQRDGGLKAFLNVCRHRGSHLCLEKQGNQKVFVCPYHAWSYKADGTLLSAPKKAFPSVDAANSSLVELPVEERHGFVWVIATPGMTIDIASYLGRYDAEFAAYGLSDYVVERETVMTEEINWKYVLDGFLEVYHIPKLHNASIAPYIYGHYCYFETDQLNSRLIVPRKSFDEERKKPVEEVDLMPHIAANYQLFPNTILVWQGDHFECWTAFPTDKPGECRVHIRSLTTRDMVGGDYQRRWDRNWKVLIDTVVSEDWAISKTVQSNIPWLTEDRVIFGRNEPGLQHFHGSLSRQVEAA